jgi:hypothetical protein
VLASASLDVSMIAHGEFPFAFLFLADPRSFNLSRSVACLDSC